MHGSEQHVHGQSLRWLFSSKPGTLPPLRKEDGDGELRNGWKRGLLARDATAGRPEGRESRSLMLPFRLFVFNLGDNELGHQTGLQSLALLSLRGARWVFSEAGRRRQLSDGAPAEPDF